MPILPILINNAHWIIPVAGWAYSEILGVTSGSEKASVSQVILSFLKAIAGVFKKD